MPYTELRELLGYAPETGELTWLKRPYRLSKGRAAGSIDGKGYRRVQIQKREYAAHRIAFCLMTGNWPKMDIDHINGDRTDNRWVNLRPVTKSVNQQNRRSASRASKSGLLGVFFIGKSWQSKIRANGRAVHVGSFKTKEDAYAAYVEAKRKFHPGCTI